MALRFANTSCFSLSGDQSFENSHYLALGLFFSMISVMSVIIAVFPSVNESAATFIRDTVQTQCFDRCVIFEPNFQYKLNVLKN